MRNGILRANSFKEKAAEKVLTQLSFSKGEDNLWCERYGGNKKAVFLLVQPQMGRKWLSLSSAENLNTLLYAGRCNLKVVTWKMNCQFILHPFTIIQAYKKTALLSPNAIWIF